jgi:hypothetical protein
MELIVIDFTEHESRHGSTTINIQQMIPNPKSNTSESHLIQFHTEARVYQSYNERNSQAATTTGSAEGKTGLATTYTRLSEAHAQLVRVVCRSIVSICMREDISETNDVDRGRSDSRLTNKDDERRERERAERGKWAREGLMNERVGRALSRRNWSCPRPSSQRENRRRRRKRRRTIDDRNGARLCVRLLPAIRAPCSHRNM